MCSYNGIDWQATIVVTTTDLYGRLPTKKDFILRYPPDGALNLIWSNHYGKSSWNHKYLNQRRLNLQVMAMSEITVLQEIREELREIKLLYKELIERLIPVEEPLKGEKKAIEGSDEIVSEEEVMEALS